MSITMHSASVPVFIRMFANMTAWLDKAEAHAQAKKFDPSVYLTARLAPDMLPFVRQIQMTSDAAKFAVARLAGVEAPKFEDNETNFAELRERIAKTVAFIKSVPADQIDGTEDKDIVIKRGDKETHYKGMQFLLGHAIPNFYFHVATTYNILRHNGIEIGKRDYLGNP